MNQEDFGALINKSRSTVGRWGEGEGLPDDFVLAAVAEHIGLSRTYFLDEQVVLPGQGPKQAAQGEAADPDAQDFAQAIEDAADDLSDGPGLGVREADRDARD